MRKVLIAALFLFGLTPLPTPVWAGVDLHPTPEIGDAKAPEQSAMQARNAVLVALSSNNSAALIEALSGKSALEDFLNQGRDQRPEVIEAKITVSRDEADADQVELLKWWTTLAQPDGVALTSAEWYPRWQAYLPQVLPLAQMALVGINQTIAENTKMTALERSQLTELQWALTGWLTSTDFADRQRFEQVLSLCRDWIVTSGVAHPLQLELSAPELRLQLADQALSSVKKAISLYGLDVDKTLASVRIEERSSDATRTQLRTSLTLLGVPISVEEELHWIQGEWRDAADVDVYPEADVASMSDDQQAQSADETHSEASTCKAD